MYMLSEIAMLLTLDTKYYNSTFSFYTNMTLNNDSKASERHNLMGKLNTTDFAFSKKVTCCATDYTRISLPCLFLLVEVLYLTATFRLYLSTVSLSMLPFVTSLQFLPSEVSSKANFPPSFPSTKKQSTRLSMSWLTTSRSWTFVPVATFSLISVLKAKKRIQSNVF